MVEGIELILKNQKYIGRLANINPLILVNGSVYWIDPEAHNIVLKEPKDQIYAKYPRALPADQWHSTNPYIDAQVRKERFERIVVALYDAGFNVGAWANRIIEDVKFSRDRARTGAASSGDKAGFGEFEVAGGKDKMRDLNFGEEEHPNEAESQPAAPAEKMARTGKVIPILAAGTKSTDAAKAPAEPPLFGVAGAPPRLMRKLETHNIVFHNGWYYGIPHGMGDIDLSSPETATMPGIIRHAKEEEVEAAIEESARWANSRGQYNDQKKQRADGTYMRVNSVGDASEIGELPSKPRILKFDKYHIAVDEAALKSGFELKGGTMLRRLASRLPPSVLSRIRNLIRRQSIADGVAGGPLITRSDGQLTGMLIRATVDAYIRRPLARMLKPEARNDISQTMSEGVPVKGEDFVIVSFTSKNAQPELMWTISNYNLVKFDGLFYALPHGISVDWDAGNVASISGVRVGTKIRDVVAMIESEAQGKIETQAALEVSEPAPAAGFSRVPILLGTMQAEGYNIVSYEGWIYGMPHELGPIDLLETDVMEMPGVIRDVSRDVVEDEIVARVREKMQAA